jgi:glycine cleavage system H lipoate-binding protein/TusA-related sulfurtransferase
LQIDYCDFPEDALYDLENNVWIRLGSSGLVRLGITSVYSALAGRLNKVKFKPIGTHLVKAEGVATIESARYFGVVRTPFSGKLIAVNSRLEGEPKVANDSPYGEGWFVEIERDEDSGGLESLVEPKASIDRIRAQIRDLRVRCFVAYPDYEMWEIGVECAAVLVRLNELLERCKVNEVVHVVSDDPTADIEMERWAYETGQKVLESRKEGNLMHFREESEVGHGFSMGFLIMFPHSVHDPS